MPVPRCRIRPLLGLLCLAVLLTPGCRAADHAQLAGTQPLPPPLPVPEPVPLAPPPTATELGPVERPVLVISELLVDPLLLDEGAGEYLELVSLSRHAVALRDLTLVLPSGKAVVPERPSAPLLQPGEVLVITPLGQAAQEARARGLRLPNLAGRVELRHRGTLVDVAQWHRKAPWPKGKPGRALERISPTSDGSLGPSWRASQTVLRGVERGSPGTVAWPCAALTALLPPRLGPATALRCSPQPRPKTRNRTPPGQCPVS